MFASRFSNEGCFPGNCWSLILPLRFLQDDTFRIAGRRLAAAFVRC